MSHLGEIVAKFRKSSPNIAAAFDEVELRLMALEAAQPSPPAPPVIQPPVGPFTQRAGELFLRNGSGTTTEKLHVTGGLTAGIGNMRWPYAGPSPGVWTLRDCKVQNVAANPPRSRDGTGEAGYWIGERTDGARLESWNSAWMEMFTGAACKGSRFTDVDLHDNPHVGLYMEHVTTDVEFRRSSFGGSRLGIVTDSSSINVEWWYASNVYGPTLPFGGKAGSYNCRFIDCDIYCPPTTHPYVCGAFLDAGTFGFEFHRCRFWGPGNAVGFPRRLMSAVENKLIDCVFENGGQRQPFYHDNAIG